MSTDIPAATPPNILFIFCDQLMPHLTGAYGHPVVKTPNLDRLVQRGVRFDAAYTPCPICAPARQSLMSGQYTSTNRCYDNAAPLASDEACYPHYLTNAGYDTVLSGKMHLVGPDQLHGFRARLVNNIYRTDFQWTPIREDKGLRFFQMINPPHPDPMHTHAHSYLGTGVTVDHWHEDLSYDEETHFRAISYLRTQGRMADDARAKGETPQPFCLTASYHHPHEPFHPPTEFWDMYEGAEIEIPTFPDNLEETRSKMDRWVNKYHGCEQVDLTRPDDLRRLRRAYYALVTYIDHKVGELLAALQRSGQADNTVVVFTSDHGDMLCERGMVQKRTFYEWSSRVPLIMAFPDGRAAGTKVPEPVNLIDLLPTFTAIAGVDPSELATHDGRNLLPLIDGERQPERCTFSEMHTDGVFATCFMVRRGAYKYNYTHGHDTQLFDLENDPGEWNNLVGQPGYERVEQELRALILAKFDPDAIEVDVRESIKRRRLIQNAMNTNGTMWPARPTLDPLRNTMRQYLK